MSARVLVTIEGGIAWVETDDPVDVFQIDWDIEDYTSEDFKAKLDELEGFKDESWYFGIRERLQRLYTGRLVDERAEEDRRSHADLMEKQAAAKTLGIREGSDEWNRLVEA